MQFTAQEALSLVETMGVQQAVQFITAITNGQATFPVATTATPSAEAAPKAAPKGLTYVKAHTRNGRYVAGHYRKARSSAPKPKPVAKKAAKQAVFIPKTDEYRKLTWSLTPESQRVYNARWLYYRRALKAGRTAYEPTTEGLQFKS